MSALALVSEPQRTPNAFDLHAAISRGACLARWRPKLVVLRPPRWASLNAAITVCWIDQNSCDALQTGRVLYANGRVFGMDAQRARVFAPHCSTVATSGWVCRASSRCCASQTGTNVQFVRLYEGEANRRRTQDYCFFRHLSDKVRPLGARGTWQVEFGISKNQKAKAVGAHLGGRIFAQAPGEAASLARRDRRALAEPRGGRSCDCRSAQIA